MDPHPESSREPSSVSGSRRGRHRPQATAEHFDVVVIGGGQAGLSVGYHLAQCGLRFAILDANARVGDAWRHRWDSLRLFTPARFNGLDGMPFPASPDAFPTKDEMADYLETYARRFELPVRSNTRVTHLTRHNGGYLVQTQAGSFQADQVIVAMAKYQAPKLPSFAKELDPNIVQLHSADYRHPEQLVPGPVLLVGAGNSGSEIAMELSQRHQVHLSGRNTGHVPFRLEGFWGRLILCQLVLRVLFHRLFTIKTPIGRKLRGKVLHGGGPLIRVKPADLARAGVQRVGKTVGTRAGQPLLEDGRTLKPANIIWCSGFHPNFDWIDLPLFDSHGEPRHQAGYVPEAPGCYFVGLHFLYSLSSGMIHGVGRDAQRIAKSAAQQHQAARLANDSVSM